MQRELVPITLPWKRPRKGLMVAELGATFQVERTERGWQVSVRSGKRMVLLAKDLTRQRDGQCRAEAHAATMPEVIAALENQAVESASSETAGRQSGVSSTAQHDPTDDARPEPTPVAPTNPIDTQDPQSIDFARVDDGCICGRATSGTWAADPKGHVALPHDTPAEEADRIRRFATAYFERQAQRAPPAKPRPRTAAAPAASKKATTSKTTASKTTASKTAASKTAAKKPAQAHRSGGDSTDTKPPKASRAGKPAAGKAASKRTGRKALAKKISKGRSTPAQQPQPRGKAVQQKAAAAKSTPAERLAKARQAKAAKAKKSKPAAPEAAARPREPKAKGSTKDTTSPPVTTSRSREPKAKRAAKKQRDATPDAPAPTGCAVDLQWFQVEGRPRANTPFGSFAIEPEGDRQALYFYDLNGMSTFITDRGDLRQIAAERAARGGVMPTMAQRSPELDAQMRTLFFSEDMR